MENNNNNQNEFMDTKQMLQYMQTVLDQRIVDGIKESNRHLPKFLCGKVVNVTDGGNYADVLLQYGDDTIIHHIKNNSKLVLKIDDNVQLACPTGDLTYTYIDQNKNPIQIFNAAKVKGELTVGGEDNSDGIINIMEYNNNYSLSLHDHTIGFYDWQKSNNLIGQISTARLEDSNGNPTGTPVFSLNSIQGNYLDIAIKKDEHSTESMPVMRLDNKVSDVNKTKLYFYPTEFNINPRNDNNSPSGKGFGIDSTTFKIYEDVNMNGWDINNVGTINCQHLNVAGDKSCVQQTEHFGKVKFYANESAQNWLDDRGFSDIKNGECIIYFDEIIQESLNLESEYIFQFIPEEDCHYKIQEKTPLYVKITADKDVHFAWILSGLRKGFETKRLESPDNINDILDKTVQQTERNFLEEELQKMINTDNVLKDLFKDTIADDTFIDNIIKK